MFQLGQYWFSQTLLNGFDPSDSQLRASSEPGGQHGSSHPTLMTTRRYRHRAQTDHGITERKAVTTSSTSARCRLKCIGNDNTRLAARAAFGQEPRPYANIG